MDEDTIKLMAELAWLAYEEGCVPAINPDHGVHQVAFALSRAYSVCLRGS